MYTIALLQVMIASMVSGPRISCEYKFVKFQPLSFSFYSLLTSVFVFIGTIVHQMLPMMDIKLVTVVMYELIYISHSIRICFHFIQPVVLCTRCHHQ